MAEKLEKTEKPDEGKSTPFDEKITWKEGDLVFFDKDGKEIDPKTIEPMAEQKLDDSDGTPTVHVYLPEEEDGKKE